MKEKEKEKKGLGWGENIPEHSKTTWQEQAYHPSA